MAHCFQHFSFRQIRPGQKNENENENVTRGQKRERGVNEENLTNISHRVQTSFANSQGFPFSIPLSFSYCNTSFEEKV